MGNDNSKKNDGCSSNAIFKSNHHDHLKIDDFFKWLDSKENGLSFSTLMKYFDNSFIMKLTLINTASILSNEEYELDIKKAKSIFYEMIYATTTTAIFELYSYIIFKSEKIDYETLRNIIKECFCKSYKMIGYQQVEISQYSKSTLLNITNSIKFCEIDGQKLITREDFKDWIINEFPQLFFGYHNWLLSRITEHKMEDELIGINEKTEDLSMLMNQALIWHLIFNLPGCYLKNLSSDNGSLLEKFKNCYKEKCWKKLYVSEDHGLSLNRFQSSLFNYKAATMMLIYCQSGYLYCIGSNCEYKQSPTAYGDDQTRILRIWPNFKIFDVSSDKNIYLNTKSKGLEKGLIFGYSQLKPILKIDDSLHSILHEGAKNDTIISVEAWGCGTAKEADYQKDIKKWETKNIEKMRTTKIDENWQENADKNILELAGIKTNHSERGDF